MRAAWRRLLLERASPLQLSAASFLGVLVGVSPFYGLQMLLVFVLATAFRLNRVAALSAAQISLPPFYPFLVLASLEAGSLALHGQWLGLGLDQIPLSFAGAWELLREVWGCWLVGSLLVGVVLGALVAALVLILALWAGTGEGEGAGAAAA